MNTTPIRHLLTLVLWLLVGSTGLWGQCADWVVAQDGSGDFTTVQAAIEAAPDDLSAPLVIFIKNGVYEEKLFIAKNFITLIGEDRDSTIITTAVLRRLWREEHPDDWGAATVNIAHAAADLTLANMTIRNNYADLYPDTPRPNDHTFAIRGGGDRVILLNCNVVATGGDTLSLWNTEGGMFYHNNCYFEGYVDFVCPRGYCYITDSEFFGHNLTASIWHDGSGGEDHKFVIRWSTFDGVPDFALGRHHREAAFYLLDCHFSERMATKPIYDEQRHDLQWGQRYYYHNTHRDQEDLPWMADNLAEAKGQPTPAMITAAWTFKGEWDPEAQLDGLLPIAFWPSPRDGATLDGPLHGLSWTKGLCAEHYRVYLGTTPGELPLVATTEANQYVPEALEPGRTYFWRVDVVTADGIHTGPDWSFTTAEP
ncbi:MAG: hypothetical protein KDC54_20030, partial [Lewinella sp.]|nr:hypothetical protein [Lewinella sp.]